MRTFSIPQYLTGLALVLSLIFSGCKSDLLEQTASDYFPIERRCLWYYSCGDDTIEVYGGETQTIAARNAIILTTGTCKEFFYKSDDEIDHLIFKLIDGGDRTDTLFIWTYFLPGKLISGDEWHENYSLTDTMFGSEVTLSVQIWGRILLKSGDICEIERNLQIEFSSSSFGDERDTLSSHEWYTNGIGVSRLILNENEIDEREYNLIDYNFLE